ncbi:hypothetical protein L1049_027102 [Liquidambar formosana]|uniref:Alpha/beta hydrolase fold-3 domain-containing protein n=1 Tax=Liquidambar formosana TaxID=63359 RepID=A0AAP0R2X2_LIQFO
MPPQSSPVLPWKTKIALSLLSVVTDFTRRSDGTVNRRLLSFLNLNNVPPNLTPIKGVTSSDVTVDPARDLWFRVFVPTVEGGDHITLPVIVFFHGGGFTFLRPDAKPYDDACRRFARKVPAIVVSVNYRLTPEHRYPSQYHDGFDVLKFLDQNPQVLPGNADLSKCFLAGDSAGGNLGHHVAKRAASEGVSTFHTVRVIGLIAIQPFFGGEERTESETRLVNPVVVNLERTDWHWKVFLPDGSDRDHEAANVCGPKAEDISGLVNFPKTLVFVGGFDPLQDWQKRYYEWLKRSGKEAYLIEYPKAIHAFYVFPEFPESSMLFTEVRDFVQKTIIQ